MGRVSYVPIRALLYAFLWVVALVELGVTGFRIHHTESVDNFHDNIVVDLLVTAALTLIWVPFTYIFLARLRGRETGGRLALLAGENSGNTVLWIMWLVGGAIATHKWPTKGLAGPGKQGHVLLVIVAFSWIAFGVLTIAMIFSLMEYAAVRASDSTATSATRAAAGTESGTAIRSDKPPAEAAPGTTV